MIKRKLSFNERLQRLERKVGVNNLKESFSGFSTLKIIQNFVKRLGNRTVQQQFDLLPSYELEYICNTVDSFVGRLYNDPEIRDFISHIDAEPLWDRNKSISFNEIKLILSFETLEYNSLTNLADYILTKYPRYVDSCNCPDEQTLEIYLKTL